MNGWLGLAKREKLLLIVATILAIVVVAYSFFWLPLQEKTAKLTQDITDSQDLLAWMQPKVTQLLQLQDRQQQQGSLSQQNFLPTIEKEVRQSSLATQLQRISIATDNAIALSFQQVNFDQFITWFAGLKKKYNVRVDAISIIREQQPGLVRIEARLQL